MTYPYVLISDTHAHAWSQFSSTDEDGVNSRLRIILNEMKRAAQEVVKAGGKRMFHAGDVFHVRGAVEPAVLNPTRETINKIIRMGVSLDIIPGNHDLASRDTEALHNASAPLDDVGATVHHKPIIMDDPKLAMIPWCSNISVLRAYLQGVRDDIGDSGHIVSDYDVIIHAPVDGVLSGVPDHGLTPKILASYGFKRVFAGHYHAHRDMGMGVYSIGATTHQTWSDVGTKAGLLLVYEDHVEFRASHAPSFIDFTLDDDPDEFPLRADGNYVRASLGELTAAETRDLRDQLLEWGAKGVVIPPIKKAPVAVRSTATTKAGATIEGSIAAFIKDKELPDAEKLARVCNDILAEARGA